VRSSNNWRRKRFKYGAPAGSLKSFSPGTSDPSAARVDTARVIFWLEELGFRVGGLFARALAGRTKRMLLEPQIAAAVRAIALRLLKRGELRGDEVHRICIVLNVPRIAREEPELRHDPLTSMLRRQM
jgi:hypothetical protein